MLCLMQRLARFGDRTPEVANLKTLSLSVTRQLNAWLDSLKNTKGLVGHRHQTDTRRKATEAERRRDDYLAYLRQVQEGRGIPPDRGESDDPSPD